MKNIRVLGCSFIILTTAAITLHAQDKDFKTDAATGAKYRFLKHDKNGTKPVEGDFAHIVMLWTGKSAKGDADSVYLDSHKKGGDSLGALMIPLRKTFKGSLEQGITLMAVGDSAEFEVNADSLYIKTFHQPAARIPHYVTGTDFTFHIKLVGFKTKEELKAEKELEAKKRMEQEEARKKEESADIADYLQKNNLTNVKPDSDGIYYLQITKGKGPQVKEGDSLQVSYVGTFLDGNVFDKSEGRGKGTFPILYSKEVPLIRGWISVLGKMNEGEKVKVLIPSAMGYGARGAGSIKPYTPLIFEMEMVSIKSNK